VSLPKVPEVRLEVVEVIVEDPPAASTCAETAAEAATGAGTVPVEVTGTARDGRGEISVQAITKQSINYCFFFLNSYVWAILYFVAIHFSKYRDLFCVFFLPAFGRYQYRPLDGFFLIFFGPDEDFWGMHKIKIATLFASSQKHGKNAFGWVVTKLYPQSKI
jgi:hypothetical protein